MDIKPWPTMPSTASFAARTKKLFGEQREVDVVYKLKRNEIMGLFNTMANNMATFKVELSARPSFSKALDAIDKLVSRGQPFLDQPLELVFLEGKVKVETIWDLVGWIVTVTSVAPAGANKDNYFIPLLCVYNMICRRLTEVLNPAPAPERDPEYYPHDSTMSQITWFQCPNNGPIYASTSQTMDCRLRDTPEPQRQRKEAARARKEDQLITYNILPANKRGTTRVKGITNPQRYGHCAETFPLMYIKQAKGGINKETAHGYALRAPLTLPNRPTEYPGYVAPLFNNEVFADPCANCWYLIEECMGLPVKNFEI